MTYHIPKVQWKKPSLAALVVGILLGAALFGFSSRILTTSPFNGIKAGGTIAVDAPLTTYGGLQYPTIIVKTGKEEVVTTFYRCITVKPPLATTGFLTWQLQTPAGTPGITSPPTHSVRTKTCENVYAKHPIPSQVLARIQQLKAENTPKTVWIFNGQVHADRPGKVVVTSTNSDPFILIDEMP